MTTEHKPHSEREFLIRDAKRTIRDFADDSMEESLVRFARAYLDLVEQYDKLDDAIRDALDFLPGKPDVAKDILNNALRKDV